MKKTVILASIVLVSIVLSSCNKNKTELYGISNSYSFAAVGGIGVNDGMVLEYCNSYDRTFMIDGEGDNERNSKAKSAFAKYMAPFNKAGFQSRVNLALGENGKGQATVKFYLYRAGNDSEGIKYIDSTELYTATKN